MGEVWVGWRVAGPVQRPYAVKRLRPHLRDDLNYRRMFLEEARLASMLRHAHVVPVLDAGEDDDGPYLVMDYVEATHFTAIVSYVRERGEVVPLQLVVRAMAQVARALHAAHELTTPDGTPAGLLHRDISPSNILIGFDGEARLTDFGIAKLIHSEAESTAGVLKGKLAYMAPELLRFESACVRSDLFAFGVVLFEVLAGRRLYREVDERETAKRILHEPPPDIYDERNDVPPRLVDLILRLLAKDAAARPSSAAEVGDVLETVLAELRVHEGVFDARAWIRERFSPPDIGTVPPAVPPSEVVSSVPEHIAAPASVGKRTRALSVVFVALLLVAVVVAYASIDVAGQETPFPASRVANEPSSPRSAPAVPERNDTAEEAESAAVAPTGDPREPPSGARDHDPSDVEEPANYGETQSPRGGPDERNARPRRRPNKQDRVWRSW